MALIGLKDVHVVPLQSDPEVGKATYGAVMALKGAITANMNPNASSATLFADDGPFDTAASQGEIGLELNIADLTLEQQAFLLGHTLDANGILRKRGSDVPPWVAVGYRSLKSNGKYRYVWLTKGKFTLPEENNQTKGDSIEWNTPTINASFVKRQCDDEWELVIDEDSKDFKPEIAEAWFTGPSVADGIIPPKVAVSGVSVAPTTKTMAVGDTQQLTPTVLPANATNKAVSYSSNAQAIATVSSTGLITAVATGTATITVSTLDGGFTATCEVTVS